MTRCFIAIDLPKEIQKELSEAQKQLYSDDVKMLNVKPENIHLTLKFLGEIDEKQIERVQDVLRDMKCKRFKAKLGGAGVFPNQNFIRVIWVGIEPKESIIGLHEYLDAELSKLGFQKDKEFESHATLARVKTVKDKKEFADRIKKLKVKPIEFEVTEIALKKSTLLSSGPVYEDIFVERLQ